MIAYTTTEKPWKDPHMARLATFNDSLLYLLLCGSLENNAASNVAAEDRGYISISLFLAFILGNLILIAVKSVHHVKLLYKRYLTRKSLNKVAAAIVKRKSSLAAAEKLKEVEAADVAIRVATE